MTGPARVTTVVATRNRWPDLRHSLPRHTGPVILVDNGSDDGTPRLVRDAFPHVVVVELAGNQGAVARNVGVAAARPIWPPASWRRWRARGKKTSPPDADQL